VRDDDTTLDAGVLARNQAALADVRITDWRPLLAAYNQLQRIRQYYEFTDIDVDRYDLKAGRQQVMLATREMDPASLAQVARTWQNTHLIYTHGQGVVVSPVNTVSSQGLPELLEHDIPAVTDEPALNIETPQVYSRCDRSITLWSAPVSMSSTDPATMRRLRCVVVTRWRWRRCRRWAGAAGNRGGHRRWQPPAQR